ncbi:hypothetical protein fugu_013862, partial [Takifugu bimaculatus]
MKPPWQTFSSGLSDVTDFSKSSSKNFSINHLGTFPRKLSHRLDPPPRLRLACSNFRIRLTVARSANQKQRKPRYGDCCGIAAWERRVSPVYSSGSESLDRTERDRDLFSDLACKMDTVTSPMDTRKDVQIKVEPEGDVEIGSYPVLKNVSIRLTDCSLWLEGRDFLSLEEHPHVWSHRPTHCCSTNAGRKMVYCSECSRGFYKRSHLEAHQRSHRGEQPNQCWRCGKSYPTLMSLIIHQQIHDRQAQYRCS